MFTSDAEAYRERADMHDRLSASTSDPLASKMHRAMAAEFRRKADEGAQGLIQSEVRSEPIIQMAVAAE